MDDRIQINQDLAEPISRLPELSAFDSTDRYALFRGEGREFGSYRLRYDRFVKQLVSDISARFGLSSMAFRDRSEYAAFDHVHQYTGVDCYPAITPQNSPAPVHFMTMDIEGAAGNKAVRLYTPCLSVPPQPKPSIGEVKMVASENLTAEYGDVLVEYTHFEPDGTSYVEQGIVADANKGVMNAIADGNFDGWTYPDGGIYYRYQGQYDFSEAYNAFGGQGDFFRVPALTGFFKPNPGVKNEGALAQVQGQKGIPPHTHELADFSESGVIGESLSVKVYMNVADNASQTADKDTVHKAGRKGSIYPITNLTVLTEDLHMDLHMTAADKKSFAVKEDPADETYPAHYVMPVKIYIGGQKTAAQYEIKYGVTVTDIFGNKRVYENITRLTRNSIGVSGQTDSRVRKIVVGNEVSEIETGMFAGFLELVEVDMGSCSKEVDVPESCFDGCVKLERFIWPRS